jgi:chaperonin GroES
VAEITGYIIKTPKPIFRRNLRHAPAHPIDDRILVRENKPESETKSGIKLPDSAVERCMDGILIAAGDAAADYLYDRGIEIGDVILYAKYAGVVDRWQHVVGPDDPKCEHDGAWESLPRPSDTLTALRGSDKETIALKRKWDVAGGNNENIDLKECRACGTLIASERHIVMSCKDVLMSVDLQERLETGVMSRYRGDADGKPRHYIKREKPRPETFEYTPPEVSLKGVA